MLSGRRAQATGKARSRSCRGSAFGPPPLRPPEALDAGERRTLKQFFAAPPDGARLFVAEGREGTLLGLAYAERAVDYFTEEPHGHLGILVVAAEAEGHGLGRALLGVVEQWAAAAGYRFVTLNVFAANRHAVAVYERAGYRPDTIRYVKEWMAPHRCPPRPPPNEALQLIRRRAHQLSSVDKSYCLGIISRDRPETLHLDQGV